MSNLSCKYDEAKNLTANAYAREYTVSYDANDGSCSTSSNSASYTFAGWATSASGTKAYDDKASVKNLTATAGGTYNLYACWNSASVTLPSATKTNAVLEGWYNGDTKVGEAGASYTPTANVTLKAHWVSKYPFEISGSNYSLSVDGEQANAFTFTHAENPTAHIAVTSIDPINNGSGKVIEYDAANNKIIAKNAGVATIYFTQEATSTILSGTSATYTITVSKLDNHISIEGTADSYEGNMYVDASKAISLTATNTDYTNSPISYNQTSGTSVATFNGSKVTSNYALGDASWSLSQPENYKYKAAAATFTIHVVKAAEATNCYVLDEPAQWDGNYSDYKDYTLPGPGAVLTLNVWKTTAATYGLYVEEYNGDTKVKSTEYDNSTLTTSAVQKTITLQDGVTKIRVKSTGGTLDKHCSNVRVTRKTYLEVPDVTVDKTNLSNPVCPGDQGVGKLVINRSFANGGELKVVWDNAKFTINGKTSAEGVNLGAFDCATGKSELPIVYSAIAAGDEVANVVIYNDVYRTTAKITGTAVLRTQEFAWHIDNVLPAGYSIAKSAAFTSTRSTFEGVTYSFSPEGIIEVEGDNLVARAAGTVEITAHVNGGTEYAEVNEKKTVTVTNDLIQTIVWNQSLLNLHLGDADLTLTATATSDEAGCTTNGSRAITYTSANESIVKVVNGNELHIVGAGNTKLTATQAGGADADGHTYAAVSVEKKVVVRDPSAVCENYIYEQTENWTKDLGWNSASHSEETSVIDFAGNEPGAYSFDFKGEYHKVAINYFNGSMYVDEYVNGNWNQVEALGSPAIGTYKETSHTLSRNATKMRVRVDGYTGYFYYKDCQVTLARYIEVLNKGAVTNDMNFSTKCGAALDTIVTIRYSNLTDNLTFTLPAECPFSLDKTSMDATCGDKGSINLKITYSPLAPETDAVYDLVVSDGTSSHIVHLHASATITDRVLEWNQTQTTTVYHNQTVTLTAAAKTSLGDPAGTVQYTIVSASPEGFATLTGNVLSFTTGGTVVVEANVVQEAAYTTPAGIQKSWTITRIPAVSFEGTDPAEPLVWGAEDNWDAGYVPTAEDNVVINSDVVIVGDVEVKSLTIAPSVTATINVSGTLTIGDGDSFDEANYGNLVVVNGGKVVLGTGTLKVNDFVIESALGDLEHAAVSGQATNPTALAVEGEAYIDIKLDPTGVASYGWYAFTVPFPVSIKDGIYFGSTKLTNERDYAIMQYQGDVRATGAYGWIKSYKVDNILHPGVFYLIGVADTDYATLRFKKTADGQINNATSTITLDEFPMSGNDAEVSDAGWNGYGNPTLSYQNVSFGGDKVQVYYHASNSFDVLTTADHSFVVGSPFFAKYTGTGDALSFSAATHSALRAPGRSTETAEEWNIRLGLTDDTYVDQIYLSASDDALATYEEGHDLVKASFGTPKVAQMAISAYGMSLCDAELPLVGGEAEFPLLLTAPASAQYQLYVNAAPADQAIYLLHNGNLVWDLTLSPYALSLAKGNNAGYSLLVQHRSPSITTGLDQLNNAASAEKVILDGHVYILKEGKVYDAVGRLVR